MEEKLKVYDYAVAVGVSLPTVYRHIKAGKLETETIDGVTYVIINEEQIEKQSEEQNDKFVVELKAHIKQQQAEIDFLRDELSEARQNTQQIQQIIQQIQQDAADAQQRSDTIIMQLTKQLERQTLALEDMRKRSFWRRIKMAFIRFGSPIVTEQRGA